MTTPNVDLNLLRVLDALLEAGSVSGAATKLHLSAPAVSRSLGRLRRALDDPLFVRSGRGLVPTPRALAMQTDVRETLDQVTRVLAPADEAFDPAMVDSTFTISAGDAIIAAIGLRLVQQLRQEAPRSSVTFLPDTNEAALLRSGEAILDLGSSHGLGNEIDSEVLFADDYVVALRTDHPLAGSTMTPTQFAAGDHVVVSSKGQRRGHVDDKLAELGLQRDSLTVVPSFVAAVWLVAESEALVVLPKTVVNAFSNRLPITSNDLPVEVPTLAVTQSWHRRNGKDPTHQWLRQTVRKVSAPRVADCFETMTSSITDSLIQVAHEADGAVRVVTLNRAEKRNALNAPMLEQLQDLFETEPPTAERLTVLRGAGPVFCAGVDLKERDTNGMAGSASAIEEMLHSVAMYPLPVVAIVHGDAIAGGNELALHCDLVIASHAARFGMSLAQIGLAPTWFLAKKIMEVGGPVFAREMLLLGDPVSATRMADLGMILRAVPAVELETQSQAVIDRLAANAPLSLRAMKAVLTRQMQFRDNIDHADVDDLVETARQSKDAKTGITTRLSGGTATFEGL